jgi:membrane associated rhomboid family serine protease
VFFPFGDEPNDKTRTAWANYALMAANVVAFFAAKAGRSEAAYQAFVEAWGSIPAAPNVETMFTSMFMHANLLHLAGNMLFLWIYGDNVEARLGSVGYVAVYLASGLAGNVLDMMLRPGSPIPGIGASGAISGVLGCYLIAFPRNRVKVFMWLYWFVRVLYIPAWLVILVWFVVIDNLLPVLAHVETGVAHGAHLGGFAAGAVVMLLLRPVLGRAVPPPAFQGARSGVPRGGGLLSWGGDSPYAGGRTAPSRFGGGGGGGQGTVEVLSPSDAVHAAWAAGRWEEAAQALSKALSRGQVPSIPEGEFIRIAVWLYDRAHFEEARQAFRAFLSTFPSSRNAPVASFALGMILSRRDGDREGARPYLLAAARGHPDPAVRDLAQRELER